MNHKFKDKMALLTVCEEMVERLEYKHRDNLDTMRRLTESHSNETINEWDSWDRSLFEDAESTIEAIETVIKHLEKLI